LGALSGIAILTDPLVLGVVFPMCLWLASSAKDTLRNRTKCLFTILAVTGILVFPWFLRNYRVFGRIVLVKSNLGHELLLGNFENASGLLSGEVPAIERHARGLHGYIPGLKLSEPLERSLAGMNEAEWNSVLLKLGVRSIAEDPVRFLLRSSRRILQYWTLPRKPSNWMELVSDAAYLGVLVCGVVGLFMAARRHFPLAVVVIPISFFPLAHYVTIVGLHRYRFPLEPYLILLASFALVAGARRLGGVLGPDPTT
jgi:hypothetical protein